MDKPGVLAAVHLDFQDLDFARPTKTHAGIPELPSILHTVGTPIPEVETEWIAWMPKVYKAMSRTRNDSRAKHVAVHGYAPDGYLADVWSRRAVYWDYFKQFDLCFTPNFSVYDNAPRIEQLINMYRTTVCYAEMVDAGLPVVLDVAWGQWPDILRQAEYIRQVHPPVIAMSLQGIGTKIKASKEWLGVAAGYISILNRIPKDIQVIFVGVGSLSRANTIREMVADPDRSIIWMNTVAYMQSRYGRLMTGKKVPRLEMSRDAVFQKNVKEMDFNAKRTTL